MADDKKNIPEAAPPAEAPAPAVENVAVPEQPVPEPALTDAEAVMLEHEGQAALFEMGEAVPDPADAVTHAEVEKPVAPEVPKAEKEQEQPPTLGKDDPAPAHSGKVVDFAAARDEAAKEEKKVVKQKPPTEKDKAAKPGRGRPPKEGKAAPDKVKPPKPRDKKSQSNRIVKRVRYVCYGKTRKQTECDGQTGYTAHTLDGIIDKVVRQIFERMKAVPKSEIVNVRYKEKMDERRALLRSIRADYTKASGELEMLRAEVIKSLRGESAFSQSLLGSLIADAETKCLEVQHTMEAAQAAYNEGQAMLDTLNAQYDDIISWADMYDSASVESKKMIVSCLIRRVEVYRDYRLHIDFNIDFEQFSAGLDISAIAA